MQKKYNQYLETMRKKADVDFSIAVLSWDKEVYLPKKGANLRAQQVATLEGISFEIFSNK
jgi:carboxypeptidase Taq